MSQAPSYNMLIETPPLKTENVEKKLVIYFVEGVGWKVRFVKGFFTYADQRMLKRVLKVAFREHRYTEQVKSLNRQKEKDNENG